MFLMSTLMHACKRNTIDEYGITIKHLIRGINIYNWSFYAIPSPYWQWQNRSVIARFWTIDTLFHTHLINDLHIVWQHKMVIETIMQCQSVSTGTEQQKDSSREVTNLHLQDTWFQFGTQTYCIIQFNQSFSTLYINHYWPFAIFSFNLFSKYCYYITTPKWTMGEKGLSYENQKDKREKYYDL